MKHWIKMDFALVLVLTFAGLGCAQNSANQRIDEKVSSENAIQTPQDLRTETTQLIHTDANITEAQRSELLSLRKDIRKRNEILKLKSLKLQAVLIKDILSPQYESLEVELIKGRIQKLESQRVSNLFQGVEEARKILGHASARQEHMVAQLFEERPADRLKE